MTKITADNVNEKLKGHEALCEERHSNIKRRLTRIEVIGLGILICLAIEHGQTLLKVL